MKVYLDNAATTPLDPAVFEAMKPYMLESYGNPSSIHSHGREVRSAIERSRKKVADLLNTSPSEIFFTSGGTEADNTALRCSVDALGIKRIITTKLEHHAVLHTAELLERKGKVQLDFLKIDDKGRIDFEHLEQLLQKPDDTLVTLMHGNNEIGNLIDIERVGALCREKGVLFHSDTVQTMGHYAHDCQSLPLDFMVGAAHKFHGPKGVGFLYVHHETKISPFIQGGSQERNMRGGTENVYGIIGLAKALELACEDIHGHRQHILGLKKRMLEQLRAIDGLSFNGLSDDLESSLYTVLNVSLPPNDDNDMLLFNLDISGISVSGGSACSSGSNVGSHVLGALGVPKERGAIRFSFSRYNTNEDIDYAVSKLNEMFTVSS